MAGSSAQAIGDLENIDREAVHTGARPPIEVHENEPRQQSVDPAIDLPIATSSPRNDSHYDNERAEDEKRSDVAGGHSSDEDEDEKRSDVAGGHSSDEDEDEDEDVDDDMEKDKLEDENEGEEDTSNKTEADSEAALERLAYEELFQDPVSDDASMVQRWQYRMQEDNRLVLYLQHQNWQRLDLAIFTMIHHLIPRPLTRDTVDDDDFERLTWLPAGKAKSHLLDCCVEGSKSRRAIFHAWIWHVLFDNLFSRDCKDKWRNGPWSAFGAILQDMQGRIQNTDNAFTASHFIGRQAWARTLYLQHGYHTEPNRLKMILLECFQKFIKARNPDFATIEDVMGDLVNQAIELDLGLLTARLDIRIEMADPITGRQSGFAYDPRSGHMEVDVCYSAGREDAMGFNVEFIARPSVRIFGEDKGYHEDDSHVRLHTQTMVKRYQVEKVLFPMEVALGRQLLPLVTLPPPSSKGPPARTTQPTGAWQPSSVIAEPSMFSADSANEMGASLAPVDEGLLSTGRGQSVPRLQSPVEEDRGRVRTARYGLRSQQRVDYSNSGAARERLGSL